MQTGAIADFAVEGEAGIDVFRRIDDPQQRRSRFECLATVIGPDGDRQVVAHGPVARRNPGDMLAVAERFAASPVLHRRFAFGTTGGYPEVSETDDPLTLFVYLDFLRGWMLADMAVDRFDAALARDDAPDIAQAAAVLRLLLDFNRVVRAMALLEPLLPVLIRGVTPRVVRAGSGDVHGYALRLAGDLMLRAGNPKRALDAFEAAVMIGENRFRRRRAIAAAQAGGDRAAMQRHLALFERRWTLPADLARLKADLARPKPGDPA